MKLINRIFGLVFCAFLLSLAANAQAPASVVPKADPRVAKALQEASIEFQISSKDGGYEITYGTKNNRRQTGYIVSETENINGAEMRMIFSFALISNAPPSQQTANLLLEKNMEHNSAWGIVKLDKGFAIVNRIFIPADLGGEKLDAFLQDVVSLADEMEERLSKKDVN